MWKIQLSMAQWLFFIIWCQVVPVAIHLWRMGDRFNGGFLLTMTSALAVLGSIAIRNGIRLAQTKGITE